MGSGAALSSIYRPIGCCSRISRFAYSWRVAGAERRAAARAASCTDPAALCSVIEHHFPTSESERRVSFICSRSYPSRCCASSVVHVSACGDAGGDAGGNSTAADHSPSGVRSPARGRGARETAPIYCWQPQHSVVTISGYHTRRRPSARTRLIRTFGRPKRALSAASPTRMRPMSARLASPAYSGRRCLVGLGTGKRMRRHGLATVLPCYSLRGRRSQSI